MIIVDSASNITFHTSNLRVLIRVIYLLIFQIFCSYDIYVRVATEQVIRLYGLSLLVTNAN